MAGMFKMMDAASAAPALGHGKSANLTKGRYFARNLLSCSLT
jgi:hypothetical protein